MAKRFSILVVDDDDVFRKRLVRALCDRGHAARGAGSYDDAMASAKNDAPEFVILDVRMPGRSGLELARDLRILLSSLRIVLLTGLRAAEVEADDLAVAHLRKPADVDEILAAMSE